MRVRPSHQGAGLLAASGEGEGLSSAVVSGEGEISSAVGDGTGLSSAVPSKKGEGEGEVSLNAVTLVVGLGLVTLAESTAHCRGDTAEGCQEMQRCAPSRCSLALRMAYQPGKERER
jgi:hypothetical protein